MKMKDGTKITFVQDTYADMFQRLYIGAYTDEEFYGDITINLPQLSLMEGEVFLSNDCEMLVKEMIEQNYLYPFGRVGYNMGSYLIAKVSQKLLDELKGGE